MERNLALAYTEGKRRRDERDASVQELLDKLNPDNDPLLNRRKKRAMTVHGNTAQVKHSRRQAVQLTDRLYSPCKRGVQTIAECSILCTRHFQTVAFIPVRFCLEF